MSYEFVQVGYSRSNDELTLEHPRHDLYRPNGGTCLIPPSYSSDIHYSKVLVECCVNMLFEATQALTLSLRYDQVTPEDFANAVTKGGGDKEHRPLRQTRHGLDVEMTNQIRSLAATLQWMVNSSSWREGEYLPFDAYEIANKIHQAEVYSRVVKEG